MNQRPPRYTRTATRCPYTTASGSGRTGEGGNPDVARAAWVRAAVWGGTAERERVEIEPEIDESDVQDALNEFANPATSGPVTLVFDKHKVVLSHEELPPALALKPVD